MVALTLENLSASTIVAANSLSLKPGQEQFLAPATYTAEAQNVDQSGAWQRVALLEGDVVGFIHGHFEPDNPKDEFRACLWRISVDSNAQGRGVGRFLTEALANEARSRGLARVTVLWEQGDSGPTEFFHRMGFKTIGESAYGDVIGALNL